MKVKTCRICLITGDNFSFLGNPLKDFIEEIFKNKGFPQDLNIRNYICFECKALLHKSYNFIQKALRAQQAMYNILETQESINILELQSIDRVQLGLCSTLSYFKVDIDFFINDNENIAKSAIEEDIFFNTPKLKNEVLDLPHEYECYLEDKISIENNIIESNFKPDSIFNSQIEFNVPLLDDNDIIKNEDLKGQLSPEINTDNVTENRKYNKCKTKQVQNKSKSRKVKCKRSRKKKKTLNIPKLKYPRKCDHCNYTIEQANIHFRHYLYCHTSDEYPYLKEATFVCQFCGIAMRSIQTLRRHELTHGEKNYKCEQCPMKFHHTERLRIHKIRKHGKRQFICDYCNKAFKQKQDLVLHIRTHTGEKPFNCHICGAGFAHRGNIGIHLRSAHNIDAVTQKKPSKNRKNNSVPGTEHSSLLKAKKAEKSSRLTACQRSECWQKSIVRTESCGRDALPPNLINEETR